MALQAKELYHVLKFNCKQCGHCCDTTLIQLSPFDLKMLCDKLGISAIKFHEQYSLFRSLDRIPRCFLRNMPRCPFKDKSNNCNVYSSRPLRCRLFPLGRIYENGKIFIVLPEEKCIGFDTGKKKLISEFLEEQNVNELNSESERWNNFLIALKDDPIIKNEQFPQLFKKVFYGFDEELIKQERAKLKEESLEEFMNNLYALFLNVSKKLT